MADEQEKTIDSAMEDSANADALLETAARPLLSYSFLFKAWMRSSDAKIISDGETIFAVNEEVCATFGYHPSQLLRQCIDMLLPDSLRSEHKKYREGYVRHPKNRPMGAGGALKARHKNGSEFPVVINLLYNTDTDETLIEATIRRIDDYHEVTESPSGVCKKPAEGQ
jgi:PAS domain S-box-containing protein